jgi:uncharacterized repeat protein (TIGR01451 family)
LSLSKTGVRHGSIISYTLLSSIVGNSGVIPAGTVITLTDAVPPELTLVSGSVMQSTSTLPWTINISGKTITATLTAPAGGIAAGTVLPAISFDVLINAGIKAGTIIENEATISAPGFAPVLASSSIEVGVQHQRPPHIGCDNNCHEKQCRNNNRDDCHHQNPRENNRDDCHNQCPHMANRGNCDHNGNSDPKGSSHAGSHSGCSDSRHSGSHSGSSDSRDCHSGSGQSHHAIIAGGL